MIAPRNDAAGDQQDKHREGRDITPITRPELEKIVSAELLIDFAENFAHKSPDRPSRKGRDNILSFERTQTGRRWPVSPPRDPGIRRLDATREIVNTE